MSQSKTTITKRVDNALAEARAIRFAAAHGALTYEQAKTRAEELLKTVNEVGEKIAKKYKRIFRKIRFSDL